MSEAKECEQSGKSGKSEGSAVNALVRLFTDADIEGFFLKTTSGFYLNECAKNDPGDAKGFYDNQLAEFTAGFECCMAKMSPLHSAKCLVYVDPAKSCQALKDRAKMLEA